MLHHDTEHIKSNQSFLYPPTAAISTPTLGEDAGDECFWADATGEAFLKVERSGNWAWTKAVGSGRRSVRVSPAQVLQRKMG